MSTGNGAESENSRFHLPDDYTETLSASTSDCADVHTNVSKSLDRNDDNEIWLIKAPAGLLPTDLNGTLVNPKKSSKLKLKRNHQTYDITFDKNVADQFKSNVVMLPDSKTGKYKITSKPISGFVSISSSLKVPTIIYEDEVKKHPTFPEGLKIRYTPFGADKPVALSPLSKKRKRKSQVEEDCIPSLKKSRKSKSEPDSAVKLQLSAKKMKKKHKKN